MWVVNVNPVLMVVLYVPSNFLVANFMFKKFGIHATVITGCVLNCLCLALRLCINMDGMFLVAMCGGFFFGIAQPLIMNANAEIASNWFSPKEVLPF